MLEPIHLKAFTDLFRSSQQIIGPVEVSRAHSLQEHTSKTYASLRFEQGCVKVGFQVYSLFEVAHRIIVLAQSSREHAEGSRHGS